MATPDSLPTETRIHRVLDHLGIEQAHFVARNAGDWQGLATTHSSCIASLTLVCPQGMEPAVLGTLGARLQVVIGDQGDAAETARRVLSEHAQATLTILRNYPSPTPYTDIAAERPDDLATAILDFVTHPDNPLGTASAALANGADGNAGEIAGISYRLEGTGPPLVLLPLSVAPSQWEPIRPRLRDHHRVIELGGAVLGMVGSLEARGHTPGYLRVVRNLLDETHVAPGESILEVGCGTGVLDRWMARYTQTQNPISAVDVNPFLLREARALVRQEGLEQTITFREGSAEALPFPDDQFDVTLSSTVIQRADAERKLAEMVRVTKPGGRVAVVGHAHDMPRWLNLPLPPALKAKLEAPGWDGGNIHPQGCDEASLYRRFHQAGLVRITMFPQFAAFDDSARLQYLQSSLMPTLTAAEAQAWRDAVAQAEAEGTFFIATPFHSAVGIKP